MYVEKGVNALSVDELVDPRRALTGEHMVQPLQNLNGNLSPEHVHPIKGVTS